MNLDRDDLEAARWALRMVTRALTALNEPTAAFVDALAGVDAAIASDGNPKPAVRQTEWDDWVAVPQAAQLMGCSVRRVRQLAPSIGGRKRAGSWSIPKDALPQPERETK